VIIAGCFGFYWLGIKQIALAEQRMNFVSSVSHELKTPLTSILMYSQMLKSGMVKSADIQLEYHNFIYFESERLSRLINNVLQLSNLSRNKEVINLEYVGLETLQDIIASKVSTLIDKHDFVLNFHLGKDIPDEFEACVDLDAFVQIVINLVDNAVKFYNGAKITEVTRQKIDIGFSLIKNSTDKLRFSIRDFGPGISSAQRDKIFELFYRCGNELTRTTSGTGIGLALVNELVHAQGGEIGVKAEQPGVSFEIVFGARINDDEY
jgi:signal transduction histidine kinase